MRPDGRGRCRASTDSPPDHSERHWRCERRRLRRRTGIIVRCGSENLLLGDAHLIGRMGIERRLHVIAGAVHRASAAAGDCRALGARQRGIAQHLVRVTGVDERPDLGCRVERRPNSQRRYALGRFFRESVIDRPLHQCARGRGAALAVQRIDHEQRRVERALLVRVVENDDGVLAAELEMHAASASPRPDA